MSREATARLTGIVEGCEADPTRIEAARAEGDALAIDLGGELALRWRIAVVRSVIANPPDGDAVRELYGELVDRYRDDPTGMAALRPLGDEIRRLEAEGLLPSAMVARSDRRRRRT
ncbi:MAG: hypothetical protein H0X17_09585 [Deltaproteobacteria bacterium]|nr:hypothetical protein [Deltaproteobacteria bacterium]